MFFQKVFKETVISLRKVTFDDQANSKSMSKFPFLGRVITRAVAEQIQAKLNDVSSFDLFYSGFRLGYRTDSLHSAGG